MREPSLKISSIYLNDRSSTIQESRDKVLNQKIDMTTVLAIRGDNKLVIGADGQVTVGNQVFKHGAKKIRRMYHGQVLSGFAGTAADGLALYERLEKKLEEYSGNLLRASVELAREWRTDKALRRLEALLVVGDKHHLLILSGNGDIIEPDDGIAAIGSGGAYALAAARALIKHSSLDLEDVVREALRLASEICIYTNSNFTIDILKW